MNEKLRHNHKIESQAEQEQQQQQELQGREFTSVEEMLRTDAAQTIVPPGIAEKLNEKMKDEPPPGKSWWKRLLGG